VFSEMGGCVNGGCHRVSVGNWGQIGVGCKMWFVQRVVQLVFVFLGVCSGRRGKMGFCEVYTVVFGGFGASRRVIGENGVFRGCAELYTWCVWNCHLGGQRGGL
jgi:hypothetical protein